jgi:hypothetical protein
MLPFNPAVDVKQQVDERYFNLCPERLWPMIGRCLISLDEVNTYYGRSAKPVVHEL